MCERRCFVLLLKEDNGFILSITTMLAQCNSLRGIFATFPTHPDRKDVLMR